MCDIPSDLNDHNTSDIPPHLSVWPRPPVYRMSAGHGHRENGSIASSASYMVSFGIFGFLWDWLELTQTNITTFRCAPLWSHRCWSALFPTLGPWTLIPIRFNQYVLEPIRNSAWICMATTLRGLRAQEVGSPWVFWPAFHGFHGFIILPFLIQYCQGGSQKTNEISKKKKRLSACHCVYVKSDQSNKQPQWPSRNRGTYIHKIEMHGKTSANLKNQVTTPTITCSRKLVWLTRGP